MLRYVMPGEDDAPGLRVAHGRLDVAEGVAGLRQALALLLATRPGERPERPDFGCPLDSLVHEPNDGATAGLAIRLVRDAVARFEPRAEITALDALPDPADPSVLRISLAFRDRGGAGDGALDLPVMLEGAG